MSPPRISNIYVLLSLTPLADSQAIAQAIQTHRHHHSLNPAILDKAEAWLLNPATRQRYDAQLRQQQPDLFTSISPSLQLETHNEPHRLGLLDNSIHDGRGDVRIEPDVYLEQDIYATSHKRYSLVSKLIVYGAIAALILGLVLLFSWPILQRTIFAPSDWDKLEFQQALVQQGWQENAQEQYAYLEAAEYPNQLALKYEKNEVWPMLINTSCDMNPQGLCQVKVNIRTHNHNDFEFDDTVGMGLRNDLPLVTRALRSDMVTALQEARQIQVRIYNGNQPMEMTFRPE
ncbi:MULTISPECIES: hypothetical protein [Vitreoscilla]|uniref:J domain-containing protein n=1 Tax=Vitreoscilla stercoraria TaxID=61 RepID=A0ABY4EBK3_VITST|nr:MULTISPECIES: hypothetical protein [Vitreoscilla]AUZ04289.1 hypothetical protein ADP71_05050 [Vitreoscilla sp. C1]UOO91968.1 hypothetical protein LVJ81_10045 [Vitreoscilla stercoraria]